MDKHSLIVDITALAQELDRTPTANEFYKSKARLEASTMREFGRYNALVSAAGLAPNKEYRRLTNQVFEKNIEQHIQEYIPREPIERKPWPTIHVISDIHWPFHSQRVIDRFLESVGDMKPQYVIINGDAWDNYSHSRFPKSHNVFTPREEEALSRTNNENFWLEVQKRSPKSICYQMLGNHSVRPLKRILETYPEAEDWIKQKMHELFTYPNVSTIHDIREELMFGDVAIFHGYRSKLGEHRDYTQYNCINGHTHQGGVSYKRIRGQTLWELNTGLAGDPEAKGLTYTQQKITTWTNGWGELDSRGPRFISL